MSHLSGLHWSTKVLNPSRMLGTAVTIDGPGETLHTTRPIELNSAGSPNLSIAGCRGHKMS